MTDATSHLLARQRPRFSGALGLLLGALFVAGAVLTVMNMPSPAAPLPAIDLVDGAGRPFLLSQMNRQIWVAAFVSAGAPGTPLAELAQRLPEQTAVVTFVIPAAGGQIVPAAFDGGGLVLGGKREALLGAARAHFGFSGADVDRAASGAAYLLAAVDRSGRVSRRDVVAGGGPLGEVIVARCVFLLALERRPRLHALLNGCSALLLALGFVCIRLRRVGLHLTCMLLAVATTTGFLMSYLYYHFHAGSTAFEGIGWARPLYFGLLVSHTMLAAFVVPLAGTVLVHAARGRLDRHRRLARWTLPIWIYVSVTGVLIYLMLYVWF